MEPYYDRDGITIYHGDARDVLPSLTPSSVQVLVTSPPYWGSLRLYGDGDGDVGEEQTPEIYVERMVALFTHARPAMRDDGSVWLNVGDVYAASGKGGGGIRGARAAGWKTIIQRPGFRMPPEGYKPKDLTLVAPQLAAALRSDGWYLRQTIIWDKPVAVEPIRLDRPSTSHEYIYLFSVSQDSAVRDPGLKWWQQSVWRIQPDASTDHPATMPIELARRAIQAGSRPGDIILDPFMGSGTTLRAAKDLGRKAIGIELEEQWCETAVQRLAQEVLAL